MIDGTPRPYRRVDAEKLEQIRQWRREYEKLETIKQIAHRLDVSKSAIEHAIRALSREAAK